MDKYNDRVSVHYYILFAEKPTILNRLTERGEVDKSWTTKQVDKCLTLLQNDLKGRKIDTNNLSTEEIVRLIINNSYEFKLF